MINTFEIILNEMRVLCGRSFTNYWSDFQRDYNIDIQNGSVKPGFVTYKMMIRYCLQKMELFHRQDKCKIIEFMFSFMIMYPAFVLYYDTFYQIALNKAHELLEHEYLRQGEAPQCVRILHQFIEVFE